jgi:hypothetical protein
MMIIVMTTTTNMQSTIVIVNTCDGNSCVVFPSGFLSYKLSLGCPLLVFGGAVGLPGSYPSSPSSGSSPCPGFLVGTTMLGSVGRNRKTLCFYLVSGTAEVKQAIHDVNLFSVMLFL